MAAMGISLETFAVDGRRAVRGMDAGDPWLLMEQPLVVALLDGREAASGYAAWDERADGSWEAVSEV